MFVVACDVWLLAMLDVACDACCQLYFMPAMRIWGIRSQLVLLVLLVLLAKKAI